VIVQPRDGQLVLIRQTDHAAVSGLFADHWGNGTIPRPEPRDAVCIAARHHDDGWAIWENSPRIDPKTLRPYQFYALPVAEHAAFYRQGIESVSARDPYAGLLVLMHLSGLYNMRLHGTSGFGRPPTGAEMRGLHEILKGIKDLNDRLRAGLPGTRDEAADVARLNQAYKLLQVFDRLSLYLCVSPPKPGTLGPFAPDFDERGLRLTLRPLGGPAIAVSPYPFDIDPLPVTIRATVVADRDYGSDDEFRATWAAAPATELAFALRAG
jgi:hypothetical protein